MRVNDNVAPTVFVLVGVIVGVAVLVFLGVLVGVAVSAAIGVITPMPATISTASNTLLINVISATLPWLNLSHVSL